MKPSGKHMNPKFPKKPSKLGVFKPKRNKPRLKTRRGLLYQPLLMMWWSKLTQIRTSRVMLEDSQSQSFFNPYKCALEGMA